METYISLLRGINVGGHNQIRMAELKKLYESLGCEAVETYLNSGNVVFRSAETDSAALTRRLQAGLLETLDASAPILTRLPADLARILSSNPFLATHSEDSSKLFVMFLSAPPDPANLAKLIKPPGSTEEFAAGEQELFLYFPDGLGRTKLTTNFFESKLKLLTTTRNWNTVSALCRIAASK
jgi:uncharacterized protein (DUF1697 family)